ncbi:MAG: hypothetical protein P8077_01500 [Gammaproteobacteria bacterium]
MPHESEVIAQGVDELVRRLRHEGVEAAQRESDAILAEARQQAQRIVEEAQQHVVALQAESREQLRKEKMAAEEALSHAYRDLILDMKNRLLQRMAVDVQDLVGARLENPLLLEKIIVELVSRMAQDIPIADEEKVEVILPKALGQGETSWDPSSAKTGVLADLIRQVMTQVLREGVTFSLAKDDKRGIRLKLLESQVQLSVTDEAIAEHLLYYLHPRFKAMLDGIIR